MFLEGLLKRKGILTVMLAIAILCGISPANSIAMPVESQVSLNASQQSLHLEKIQDFLNKAAVSKRLAKLGLNKEQTMQYVQSLDDAQLAKLSKRIDTIDKASGNGAVILLAILLIAIFALYITDYKVKLEPRRKK